MATSRLELVPIQASDLDWAVGHWQRPEVRHHLFDDRVMTREECEEVLAPAIGNRDWHRRSTWVARWRTSGQRVGLFGYGVRFAGLGIEVSFSLEPEFWGRGVAHEAMACVLNYYFLATGAESIAGVADVENDRSRRLLTRLGFVKVDGQVGNLLVAMICPRDCKVTPPPR